MLLLRIRDLLVLVHRSGLRQLLRYKIVAHLRLLIICVRDPVVAHDHFPLLIHLIWVFRETARASVPDDLALSLFISDRWQRDGTLVMRLLWAIQGALPGDFGRFPFTYTLRLDRNGILHHGESVALNSIIQFLGQLFLLADGRILVALLILNRVRQACIGQGVLPLNLESRDIVHLSAGGFRAHQVASAISGAESH